MDIFCIPEGTIVKWKDRPVQLAEDTIVVGNVKSFGTKITKDQRKIILEIKRGMRRIKELKEKP